MNSKNIKKGVLPYVFLLLAMLAIFYVFNISNKKVNVLTYNEFITNLNSGSITEITLTPKESAVVYEVTGKMEKYKENETFSTRLPLTVTSIDKILQQKKIQEQVHCLLF